MFHFLLVASVLLMNRVVLGFFQLLLVSLTLSPEPDPRCDLNIIKRIRKFRVVNQWHKSC